MGELPDALAKRLVQARTGLYGVRVAVKQTLRAVLLKALEPLVRRASTDADGLGSAGISPISAMRSTSNLRPSKVNLASYDCSPGYYF